MPTALEILKEGIESKDFSKIQEAYAQLTGTPIAGQLERKHIEELLSFFPPKADKQESVVQPEPDENAGEELLEIEPDSRAHTPLPADTLDDSAEELIEEEETPSEEEEVVEPKRKKNTSLRDDGEIYEEGDTTGSGGRACVRVAISRAPRKNRFKDNLAFAHQDTVEFDKKVRTKSSIAAHNMIPKREAVKKVIVGCRECGRKFRIDPRLAPVRLLGTDKTTYHCDGCILRRKG